MTDDDDGIRKSRNDRLENFIAHLCFVTENVDRTMAALAERGIPAFVKAETYPLEGTVYERCVAFIKDLEANVIEFGEPLKRLQ
jgi:4-hydroxyphenylpyruvate dioxygenase-like putative hemolysin